MGGRDGFGAAGQSVTETRGAQVQSTEAAAQAAPKLPAEVIRQIVERVMVGVNKEGLSEFRIELKDNILGGTALSLTAKDGKISAKFETRDANVKRLLMASEGELARAFEGKGLRLERFEVVGPS
jgi:flagellar hook-length control protein FliK